MPVATPSMSTAPAAACDFVVPGSIFNWTRGHVHLLPHYSNAANLPSCAVVGSSGCLRGSRCQAEIDAHDVVFRANLAPTQGFELDVGSRTSISILNSVVARRVRDILVRRSELEVRHRHRRRLSQLDLPSLSMRGSTPPSRHRSNTHGLNDDDDDWDQRDWKAELAEEKEREKREEMESKQVRNLCASPTTIALYGDEWPTHHDDESATVRAINRLRNCRGVPASSFHLGGSNQSGAHGIVHSGAHGNHNHANLRGSHAQLNMTSSQHGLRLSKALQLSRGLGAFHGAIPRQLDGARAQFSSRRGVPNVRHCSPEHMPPGCKLPTAGFYAVHLALSLCGSVSLYGIGDDRGNGGGCGGASTPSRREGGEGGGGRLFHYYDSVSEHAGNKSRVEMESTHDLHAERAYYGWMATKKAVRVCHQPAPPPPPPYPPDPPSPPPSPPTQPLWGLEGGRLGPPWDRRFGDRPRLDDLDEASIPRFSRRGWRGETPDDEGVLGSAWWSVQLACAVLFCLVCCRETIASALWLSKGLSRVR